MIQYSHGIRPISLPEYEKLLEEAVLMCRNTTTTASVVLVVPSRFDEEADKGYALHQPGYRHALQEVVSHPSFGGL